MYAATANGQRLTFEAEAVWRLNMIMRDLETGTLWQHATGEGLIGPLEGVQLEILGGERATWAAWCAEHPETQTVAGPEKWPGLLPLPLTNHVLERATASGKVPGLTLTDRRLPQNEEIVGLTLNGEARAYPLALLRERGVIDDELGGVPVTLVYDATANRVRAFQQPDPTAPPQPVPMQRLWWSGWYEFHPGTTVYHP